MNIRRENPEDFPAIYSLIKTAFETAKVSDGSEQDFYEGLRAGENFIAELAFVAEENGKLIGHIALTRARVLDKDGTPAQLKALLLAPLSVLLDYRGKGVGISLVDHALEAARTLGFEAVFLCGNPDYYGRFGFKSLEQTSVRPKAAAIPLQYALYLELAPAALARVAGTLECF